MENTITNGARPVGTSANFRIQAKNYALTYSNVEGQGWIEFTKEDLCTSLKRKGASYVLVSKETHQDGSPHFHALVQFPKKKDIRNSRYFDFGGVHPNIQVVQNLAAWTTYVKKDGNYIDEGESHSSMHTLCEEMGRVEWVEYGLATKMPFQYMDAIWKAVHPSRSIASIESFGGGGTMCPDIAFFRYDNFRSKVLVLEGETGCGKTTWALKHAPKPSLLITHLDMLKKEFDPAYHKSIIFDDMSFCHLPREAQLHIVEQRTPTQIHVRYGIALIPPGTVKIFTCNQYCFSVDPAIDRRIHHKLIANDQEHRIAAISDDQAVIEL